MKTYVTSSCPIIYVINLLLLIPPFRFSQSEFNQCKWRGKLNGKFSGDSRESRQFFSDNLPKCHIFEQAGTNSRGQIQLTCEKRDKLAPMREKKGMKGFQKAKSDIWQVLSARLVYFREIFCHGLNRNFRIYTNFQAESNNKTVLNATQ